MGLVAVLHKEIRIYVCFVGGTVLHAVPQRSCCSDDYTDKYQSKGPVRAWTVQMTDSVQAEDQDQRQTV